ncbi:uncharacterized protein [Rutidosis leptorrhynchoides]|uniref:uncharacterized protein n=1 Tax=Rutidosis leptorrhynchoides TaxID=125765 RepID=UPI003A99B062
MEIKNFENSQDLCAKEGDFELDNRTTYTCSFCKRGFSNAQALGGHMNVHRKERANLLQESIQETLISQSSMDYGESQSFNDENISDGVSRLRPWRSTEENNCPESPIKEDHHGVNFKKPSLQLSLRIESSSTSDQPSLISNTKLSSLSSSAAAAEVDLELRLGMDSQATSRDYMSS